MFLTWNDADSVGLESGTLVGFAIAIFMTLQKDYFSVKHGLINMHIEDLDRYCFKNSDDSWL